MRMGGFGTRAYPYILSSPAQNGAVTLETLKAQLRITNCRQDEILQLYLNAAINTAEEYTGLALITRTYTTRRDFFPSYSNEAYYTQGLMPETINACGGNVGFELRRTPVQEVTALEYAPVSAPDTLVTIDPANYFVTEAEAGKFSSILSQPDFIWPSDLIEPRTNSIRITFTAGFGDNPEDIPADIVVAILNHATYLFSNRGDCADCGNSRSGTTTFTPPTSQLIYAKHKVRNL